jgi:hypothetical protein
MGKVRPFTKGDIPQVVELNTRLFPGSATLTQCNQEFLFNEVCLRNPWYNSEITSLVYEETNGRISGFLGVVPRLMEFEGKSINVAISQHLMVDKATLASLQLFKKLISGPQDLLIADMTADIARATIEKAGGTTIFQHSIYWNHPLRPFSFMLSFLKKIKSSGNGQSSALGSTIDTLAGNIPGNPFRPVKPAGKTRELTVDEFLNEINRFTSDWKLRPKYNKQSASWLFEMLNTEKRFGSFQKTAVYNEDDKLLGWFLLFLKSKGRSEVIQVAGQKNTIRTVLDHMYYTAWKGNAVEVCGRLDPHFTKEYANKLTFFIPGKNWMVVHTRDPKLLQAIQSNDTFLSRLEGDLWFL